MKEFSDIGAFVTHLAAIEVGIVKHLHDGLDKVAAKIEKTAKDEIGEYQDAIGPFPAWAELADSTKEDRLAKGFTENDPGLRNGGMRDSISRVTEGLQAAVGSNDDKLVWFELGTEKQPPRPVLGPAVEHNHAAIGKILGGAAVRGLMNGEPLPAHLEYDHDI